MSIGSTHQRIETFSLMPYTRLRYHFVTGTYKRRPLITPEMEDILYPELYAMAENAGGRLILAGGIADHVHLVAALRPTVSVSDFMRVVKTGGCHAVRQEFGQEAFRWQQGYGAFTVPPDDLDGLLDYVAHQKHHHATDRLHPAYEHCPPEA